MQSTYTEEIIHRLGLGLLGVCYDFKRVARAIRAYARGLRLLLMMRLVGVHIDHDLAQRRPERRS